ncbi:MAG: S8 family peptidase [Dysgonamonadaceae bacterium]|jgi:subtilisin family serine protease|nr:S8 family peptidase [Dysgonamonadaceae bacterium]
MKANGVNIWRFSAGNKVLRIILISSVFCLSLYSSAFPQAAFMYRVVLKDKGNPQFSLAHPEEFLSEKSLDRRRRQNLPIDSIDLPIDEAYLNAVTSLGFKIGAKSKWTNTLVAQMSDTSQLNSLRGLPFVDSIYCVWKGTLTEAESKNDSLAYESNALKVSRYGEGFTQIALHNGQLLHEAGFRGQGVSIAVIDGGFERADNIYCIDFSRVKEVKSFSHETSDPLRSGVTHGSYVLSCMLANQESAMIGSAPEADYYLFRTEVDADEYPVEEDYWTAALEYADSIGIDVVTTSLGYSTFNDSLMNHTVAMLDGKTLPASRAASLAASRGMLVFHAAGNERNKGWVKITFPADADNIITVGSVMADSTLSSFSSVGYAADGRIKPDLVAMGSGVCIANTAGLTRGNGTSFATPILAGLGACLWQALPNLTASEMLDVLRKSGNHYLQPDSLSGYGIPDVYKAYIDAITSIPSVKSAETAPIYAFHNELYISNINIGKTPVLRIYSCLGNCVFSKSGFSSPVDISALQRGVYIAHLQIGSEQIIRKFIKQ